MKIATLPEKATPSFPAISSKRWGPVNPRFLKIWLEVQPSLPTAEGWMGCTLWEPIKEQTFYTFRCSDFTLFFIAMTHSNSGNFKLIHFLFRAKGSHQSSNIDIFKWSGENLPNFSCHFSNHNSFFYQILNHSSAS